MFRRSISGLIDRGWLRGKEELINFNVGSPYHTGSDTTYYYLIFHQGFGLDSFFWGKGKNGQLSLGRLEWKEISNFPNYAPLHPFFLRHLTFNFVNPFLSL